MQHAMEDSLMTATIATFTDVDYRTDHTGTVIKYSAIKATELPGTRLHAHAMHIYTMIWIDIDSPSA